jgi:hypothetical protein
VPSRKNDLHYAFRLSCVLAFFGMLLAGCGGGGGSGGNDSAPGVGAIQSSVSSLDLGKTVIGSKSTRAFTVTNTGTASFLIGNTNPGAGFSIDRPCNSLAPNASCTITVEFSPTEQRAYSGSFSVGAQGISATINLSGIGNALDTQITNVTNSCPDPTVSVRVRVNEAIGTPVLNLVERNFSLIVSGSAVSPVSVDTVSIDEAASIGLMIDWSDSLGSYRQDLIDGSALFINSLRDFDRAGLYRFARDLDGNSIEFIDTDSAGKSRLVDGLFLSFVGAQNPTVIRDSLVKVLDVLQNEATSNRVVVLLTDGLRDRSTRTIDDVIERANTDNVAVFTIAFGDFGGPEAEWLERLAEQTGGRYFSSPDLNDLGGIYETILSLLSNQYVITFTNLAPKTTALLEVQVEDDAGNKGSDSRQIVACE